MHWGLPPRIFLWVFLLDTAFVIFNNLPHRMVIKEMKMHMASPEACFQAPTAESCIDEIHKWMLPSSPFVHLSLREAIESVCMDTLTPEMQQVFSQLGPLNLFAMASGRLPSLARMAARRLLPPVPRAGLLT